jgi:hypothetical protein
VRIDEVEALAHQGFFVIEHHAVQLEERLLIDEDADVVELVDTIAFAWLRVKANVVGESGAAAALDAETQAALLRRNILLRHGDTDALQRTLGDLHAFLRGCNVVGLEYAGKCSHFLVQTLLLV